MAMISREEREEVAKKLREDNIARNEAEAYVLLLHCIGIRPQLPAVNTYKPALERLADLVDPTCKPVEADNNIVCSECGADLYDDDLYCPHCGSRVVRGLETLEQAVEPSDDYIDNQTLALAT